MANEIVDDGIKVGCSYKGCNETMERPNIKEGWALMDIFVVGETDIPPEVSDRMVQTKAVLCPKHWLGIYETLIISGG